MLSAQAKIVMSKPTGKAVSFRIRYQEPGESWKAYKSPALDDINKRMKLGHITRLEAEERVRHLINALKAEQTRIGPVVIMNQGNQKLVKEYLEWRYPPRKKKRLAQGSYESVVAFFRQALDVLTDTPLETDIAILQEVIDNRLESKPRKHTRVCSTLNSLLTWLGREEMLEPLRESKWSVNYCTADSFDTLLPTINGDIFQVGAAVAFWTGLRLGELCALTEASVRGDYLYIDSQVNIEGDLTDTKTRKDRRVWLQPESKKWLKKWLDFDETERRRFRERKPSKKVRVAAEKSLGRKLSFHDLRHSRAVYLIGKGVPIEIVAQNLGNSPRVCERHYYGHKLSDDGAEYMQKLLGKDEK